MSLKYLIWPNDIFGLGHISRALQLSGFLQAHLQDLSILILTGSSMIHGLHLPPGVDYVKLPRVLKASRRSFASKYLPLPFEEVKQLRERIILEVALTYQPDLLLVDFRPGGIRGELLTTLRALRKSQTKTVPIILLFRDILDEPERIRAEWHADQAVRVLEELHDEIWVLGCQGLLDPIKEYELSNIIARKIRFCGYLGGRAHVALSQGDLS